jgi:hypothetical protein
MFCIERYVWYIMLADAAEGQVRRGRICLFVVKPGSNVRKREALNMAKKQDRRVQRTQQAIRRALFELIQEKGFEALSVQDLIDRANVG